MMRSRSCPSEPARLGSRPAVLAWVALLGMVPACSRRGDAGSVGPGGLEGQNLLLITLDTTRADRIGVYGHRAASTPAIDALAGRGVAFRQAFAQVPLTLPSHASLLTGRYPREHGVRVNGRNALGRNIPTLATLFKDRGYRTGAFVSAFVLDSRFGLDRGFDVYEDDVGDAELGGDVLEMQRPANAVADAALDWLKRAPGERFFCWVHFYDPHHPYAPPPAYRSAHPDPYDGEIAFMDSQIRRLVDWLSSAKLAERTMIVVIGDHGESFGEHGEFGHTIFLYDTNLWIPLIFTHPKAAAGGRWIEPPVSLVDVFPTVADWFGLSGPTGLLSRSLVSVLGGSAPQERDSFAENNYVRMVHGWSEQRSLTTDRWKYVASAKPELFDRRNDPAEGRNLAAVHPDVAQRMDEALRQRYAALTALGAAEAVLDERATKALESLGYLSAAGAAGGDDFLTPDLPDPKDHTRYLRLIDLAHPLFSAERFDEAVPLLEEARALNPNSVRVLGELGRSYVRLRNIDRAIEVTNAALKLDPENCALHRTMGDALSHADRHSEAAEHFRIALAIRPDDPQTLFNHAFSLLKLDKQEEAVAQLREALRLKPDYDDAKVNLAAALTRMGQSEEAGRLLASASGNRGNDPAASINLGKLQISRGETAAGIETLEKALAESPGDERVVTALAPVYFQARRTSDLARVLRSALAARPDNVRFLHSLAEILATSSNDAVRDGREAVALARRAADLTSHNDPEVLAILAAAYAEAGDFDAAGSTIERALSVLPGEASPGLRRRVESFREAISRRQAIRHQTL